MTCLLTVGSTPVWHSILNVKVLVGTFIQEKALVGSFSVIVKPSPKNLNTGSRFLIDDKLYESGDVESHCSTLHRAGHPGQYSGPFQPISVTMILLWLRLTGPYCDF